MEIDIFKFWVRNVLGWVRNVLVPNFWYEMSRYEVSGYEMSVPLVNMSAISKILSQS